MGTPEWFDPSGFAMLGPAADLGLEFSGIIWSADSDRLYLELAEVVVVVLLETVG